MKNGISDIYDPQSIAQYNGVELLTLWENCVCLEQQLQGVKTRMTEEDRKILECYLTIRNDLEREAYKAALHRIATTP